MFSNKGLSNHSRFRTKFWHQRQAQAQLASSFIDSGMIQGERIARSPFRNPAIGVKEPSHLNSVGKSAVKSARGESKVALKLELMSLTIENQERCRPRATVISREGSPWRPSKRPKSITIEVSPGRYSSLEQNITLIENNRYELFLPLRSARYSRIHS